MMHRDAKQTKQQKETISEFFDDENDKFILDAIFRDLIIQ
jgi:hypothetical protein